MWLSLACALSVVLATGCGDDGPPAVQPAGPTCGNGVVDIDEQCERLAGCTGDERCTADCLCEAPATRPPNSQDLIDRAFAAGVIDYPTSLEYRVWALFAAPELPAAYDGTGNAGEDTSLFIELSRIRGQLPAPIAAAIAPYLVRPTDPLSVYSIAPMFTSAVAPALVNAGDPPPIGCPPSAVVGRADWRAYETEHFVVWSCGGGVNGTDPLAAQRGITGALAEEVYSKLVPKLKVPRSDDLPLGPSPTTRTDIYLLVTNQCRNRGGVCVPVGGDDALAAAVTATPCDAVDGPLTTSSYLIIDANQVPVAAPTGPSKLRATLAHELFHAISFNLNFEAQGGSCTGGQTLPPSERRSWFTEASAEWVSASFVPSDSPSRRKVLFDLFQNYRPNSKYGLHSTEVKSHPYEAFLYLYFVQEETNDKPDVLLSFWNGNGGARTIVDLDNRLNALFPFNAHFRDFAVRNVNRDLPGSPIAIAHAGFDEALPFTDEFASKVLQPVLVFAGPVSDLESRLDVAPLAMQLERYQLQPDVRFLKIDASTVGNGSHLALDAIVKIKGEWSRRRIEGQVFEFCRDNEKDDIDELYVVYSNFDHSRGGKMQGNFRMTSQLACPGGWRGTFKLIQTLDETTFETQPSGTSATTRHDRDEQIWTVTGTRLVSQPGAPPGSKTETIDTSWQGSKSVASTSSVMDSCGTATSNTSGSGTGSSISAFAAFATGAGGYTIQPTMAATSYMIDTVSMFQNCPSGAGTTYGQQMSAEAWSILLSIPEFALLTPKPNEPGHFVGRGTYLRDVQPRPGGQQVIDISGEWDLTRTSGPPE